MCVTVYGCIGAVTNNICSSPYLDTASACVSVAITYGVLYLPMGFITMDFHATGKSR